MSRIVTGEVEGLKDREGKQVVGEKDETNMNNVNTERSGNYKISTKCAPN